MAATLLRQSVSAGEHQWTWRPSPGRVTPGLYLVRVASRGRAASAKMVWTP